MAWSRVKGKPRDRTFREGGLGGVGLTAGRRGEAANGGDKARPREGTNGTHGFHGLSCRSYVLFVKK